MAVLDLHIHIGNEHLLSGAIGNRPDARPYTGVTGFTGQGTGYGQRMKEFGRIEPSDATGADGTGAFKPYWDGVTSDYTVVSATSNTVTFSGKMAANEFAAREITVQSGTGSGTARILSHTGNGSYGVASNVVITIDGTWDVTPVASDVVRIGGGFVKYSHVPGTMFGIAQASHPTQQNSNGDNWWENKLGVVGATTLWINRLVAEAYGFTGRGFKFYKRAVVGGVGTWQAGQTAGDALAADLAKMQAGLEAESTGDTMIAKSVVLDASDADIFGINLYYQDDTQRTIDSLRDQLDTLGLVAAADEFTATAATTTTLTVSGAGWTANEWRGRTVRIDSGAASGELKLIASNTEDTITIATVTPSLTRNYTAFSVTPGTASFSILAAPLIVLVSHKSDMNAVVPVLSPAARHANLLLAGANVGVKLVDMESSEFGTATQGTATADPLRRYYTVPSYLNQGLAIHTVVQNYYATVTPVAPGAPIPCIMLVGTSQFVTAGVNAGVYTLSSQRSFLGDGGGNAMPLGYTWNDLTESVEQWSAGTNSSTFGTVGTSVGPSGTMMRNLIRDEFPTGVVIFQYAVGGGALTSDAESFGSNSSLESDFDTVATQWVKFKQACIRDLGRSPDTIAICVDHSENDMAAESLFTAFSVKAPLMAQTLRDLATTRIGGNPIRIVWMRPPPRAGTVPEGYGSTLHNTNVRDQFRDWIKNDLPTLVSNVGVIENATGRFELNVDDIVHYGGIAVQKIGEELAADIIANYSVEGELPVEAETAAFIVETGSGLPDANAYTTVAEADTYHLSMSNPAQWTSATDAQKESAIRRATTYIDDVYGGSFRGVVASITQRLLWPRLSVVDGKTGVAYVSDTIPRLLKEATAEVAVRVLAGIDLDPDLSAGVDNISSSSFSVGGISVSETFAGSKSTRPRFPVVERKLSSLRSGYSNSSMVRLTR